MAEWAEWIRDVTDIEGWLVGLFSAGTYIQLPTTAPQGILCTKCSHIKPYRYLNTPHMYPTHVPDTQHDSQHPSQDSRFQHGELQNSTSTQW